VLTPGDLEKARACARAHRAAATHAPCAAARQRPGGEGGCSTRSGSGFTCGRRAAAFPPPTTPHPAAHEPCPARLAPNPNLNPNPTPHQAQLGLAHSYSRSKVKCARPSCVHRRLRRSRHTALPRPRRLQTEGLSRPKAFRPKASRPKASRPKASRPKASADRRPSDRRPPDRRPPDRRPPDEGFPQPPPGWRQLPASCLPPACWRRRPLPPPPPQLPRLGASPRCRG
jgi:hypothetical protein